MDTYFPSNQEKKNPNKNKLVSVCVMTFLLGICAALGVESRFIDNASKNTIDGFSDIPGSPYHSQLKDFDTMQVAVVQEKDANGNPYARVVCRDATGQYWPVYQDNEDNWHGGSAFVNDDDSVVVGTGSDENIKHIVKNITAERKAANWLNNHQRINGLPKSQKLGYVTGVHSCVDGSNRWIYVKCVTEGGKVVIGWAENPKQDDAITHAAPGQELIVEPGKDNFYGKVVSAAQKRTSLQEKTKEMLYNRQH